ncbi:MAG: radical SAM protein [Candidatus Aminicenantes bacterium]|nr:radical SAM protein [Candidatus Aminicenantes bacterium]
MRDKKRLYYRFRAAPYYGGIATADGVGCCFLCAYCWNYYRNLFPDKCNRFYSPQQVAYNLLKIARKKYYRLFRITGSEPILGEKTLEHVVEVIKIIFSEEPRSVFILESNGFFLGYKPDLIKKLKFKNLWIRVSLKGVDKESFEHISGAKKEFFHYPLIAIRELRRQGIKAWPAIMGDLFREQDINRLKATLAEYNIHTELEFEFLEKYPFVLENLSRRNISIKRI